MLINNVLINVVENIVENSSKIIIITHGLAEHHKRYDNLVNVLNQNNISVVRYDLRGHGFSQGKRGSNWCYKYFLNDLHEIVKYIKTKYNQKIILFGHSMGGLIVNLYATFYKDIDGVISSAAPTDFLKDVLPLRVIYWPLLGFINKSNNLAHDMLTHDKKIEDNYNNDPLVLKSFKLSLIGSMMVSGVRTLKRRYKKINTRILYIHGKKDKIVPYEFSFNIFNKIPSKDKKIILLEESYHEIFNDYEKEKAINYLLEWVKRYD